MPGRRALWVVALAFVAGRCAGPPDGTPSTASRRPNVIIYVIDGAAAERLSLYGYARRTTPYLERLAAEGAVFERAYSNASTTKASVPSFMTSLLNSVLGGTRQANDQLPPETVTMAELMRRAGYATEVLTSNPYCGALSGLDRGVDFLDDAARPGSTVSSADLHAEFWRRREAGLREPFWVHFQPTDVHRPWSAGARMREASGLPEDGAVPDLLMDLEGDVSSAARLVAMAGDLYDSSMAFQDRSLGRFVDRLKESGVWGRTLFVVTADHSQSSAGLPFYAPDPPKWPSPILAAHKSHIPLIFIWPGRIAPGRRFSEPVSLVDLLPTILDLIGLPPCRVSQGRSLAPLLFGRRGFKPRPVVLAEFRADDQDIWGSLEVIDRRWGASLWIDSRPVEKKPRRDRLRPAPLLLFDIAKDPHALRSLHDERPDLVRKYAKMLALLWKDHLELAERFSRAGPAPMTARQIEALRSLGYLTISRYPP